MVQEPARGLAGDKVKPDFAEAYAQGEKKREKGRKEQVKNVLKKYGPAAGAEQDPPDAEQVVQSAEDKASRDGYRKTEQLGREGQVQASSLPYLNNREKNPPEDWFPE